MQQDVVGEPFDFVGRMNQITVCGHQLTAHEFVQNTFILAISVFSGEENSLSQTQNLPSLHFLYLLQRESLPTSELVYRYLMGKCKLYIVRLAEQYLRVYVPSEKPVHAFSRLGTSLEIVVLQSVDLKQAFAETDHIENTIDEIDNHVSSLVRQIIRTYMRIRKFHMVKNWNISQKGLTLRQSLTKLVLFKNQ